MYNINIYAYIIKKNEEKEEKKQDEEEEQFSLETIHKMIATKSYY